MEQIPSSARGQFQSRHHYNGGSTGLAWANGPSDQKLQEDKGRAAETKQMQGTSGKANWKEVGHFGVICRNQQQKVRDDDTFS